MILNGKLPSKGWEMSDYYLYLWKVSWIEALGFVCLTLLILARLIWKAVVVYKQGSTHFRKFVVFLKGLGWIGILSAYLLMIYVTEPDWFAKPQWIQGEVQGKTMTQSSGHPYTVEIQSEVGSKTLSVDELSYQELDTGQNVKMSYLSHRLEVVTCEILP